MGEEKYAEFKDGARPRDFDVVCHNSRLQQRLALSMRTYLTIHSVLTVDIIFAYIYIRYIHIHTHTHTNEMVNIPPGLYTVISIRRSICLAAYRSTHLSLCSSIRPSTYLHACLPT